MLFYIGKQPITQPSCPHQLLPTHPRFQIRMRLDYEFEGEQVLREVVGVYSNISINRIRMHQFCLEAIYNRDYSTLKEIMLKFNYFLEISHQLQDPLLNNIVANLNGETIAKHEPLTLEPSNIYFFFEKGAIYRKENTGKSEKSIRIREKNRHFTNNAKNYQKLPEIKQQTAYQIDQFDSFEEKGYSANKNVYYSFSSKPTIALRLPLNSLSQDLRQTLRTLANDKIKFLAEYGLSINLEKHIIIDHIHKFQYMMMSFSQRLYNQQLRPQHLFFLKNGMVQIHQSGKPNTKCIVNAKAVIGLQRREEESARCVSDRLECYIIKKDFLNRHFAKYREKKTIPTTSPHYLLNISKTAAHTPIPPDQQSDNAQNKQQTTRDRSRESQFRQTLTRGKNGHWSVCSLKQRGEQKCRLFKLKQHFSNFYNEVFEQYSERKVRHMGLNLDNKENLVLYNLKVLERKAPDMNEIKHKLSKIRMEKLNRCKQKLREGHHRELTFTENRLARLQQ